MNKTRKQELRSWSSSPTLNSLRYDIPFTIRNRTRQAQRFFIFKKAPRFSSSGLANANLTTPPVLNVTAYQTSRFVASGSGSITFMVPSELSSHGQGNTVFVITGCSMTKINEGMRLFPSDFIKLEPGSKDANLPSGCVMTMQPGWEPSFKKCDDKNPYSPPGKIRIDVDPSFKFPKADHPYVGIGALNPRNTREIMPLITWEAVPGATYLFKPDDFWQCACGTASAGAVIDAKDWVEKPEVELVYDDLLSEAILEWDGILAKA